MPFTVELRAGVRDARLLASLRGVELPLEVIRERKGDLPLLGGIDPYANTYFNQLQMKDIYIEMAELAAGFDGDVRDTLERVLDLAMRGSEEPHRYLVFIGD